MSLTTVRRTSDTHCREQPSSSAIFADLVESGDLNMSLTDVPGIEKAGYGEFGYAGDDATRDALKDD